MSQESKKGNSKSVKKKGPKAFAADEPWYIKYAIPLFALLIFIVYIRSLSFGFTYLDDSILMLDRGPWNEHAGNIFKAFTEGVFNLKDVFYRPLFTITFVLERQILFLFPPENFVTNALHLAHAINLLLHFINVILLFKLLQKLSFSRVSAFMCSAIFAVHPVLTMAVAWIPGRNDLMLSIFILSYFLNFLNYTDTGKKKSFFLFSLFFLLSLLTKETAVFIPFVSVIYLLIYKRAEILNKKWLIVLPVWVAEGLAWFLLRHNVLSAPQITNNSFGVSLSTAIGRIPGLIQYTGKIFLPFNLTVYPTIYDTTYIYGIISIIALVALLALNKNRDNKLMLFGAGWFLFFILPLFFVPKEVNDGLFEHRLYIPIIGMFLVAHEAVPAFGPGFNKNLKLIWVGILILFSSITFTYMNYFSDQITFYKKVMQDSPSSEESDFFQAFFAFQKNDMDGVKKYLKKFIEKKPVDKRANNNLLKVYRDTRDKPAALRQIDYMKARKIQIDSGTIGQIYTMPDSGK